MTNARSLAGWVALLACTAAPLAAAAWVVSTARDEVEVPSEETWTAVGQIEGDALDLPVGVALEWSTAGTAPAPSWSGLVDAILVRPGGWIETGTPVARIDGITRIASSIGSPIGRALQRGDAGPDVETLNATLRWLGHPAGDGTSFTASTETGVRRLATALGAGDVRVFDPAWIVFLPDGGGEVAEVSLRLGRPAPAAGDDVLSLRAVVVDAVVADLDQLPLDAGAENAEEVPTVDELRGTLDIAVGSVVVVDGSELALGPDGTIEPGALGHLAEGIEAGQPVRSGVLRRPAPEGLVQVPTAAVVAGPSGATCVVQRVGTEVTVVMVDVVDAYVGTTYVSGPEPSSDVLVDPPTDRRAACR